MKKLILLLLFPVQLFAQIDGVVIFDNNTRVDYANDEVIEYFTRNIYRIESVGGQSEVAIPIYKVYFKNTKGLFVDNYFCQFDDAGKDVTIKKCDSKMIVFDFDKKTINGKAVDKKKPPTVLDVKKSAKNQNHDDNDWQKPKDLEKKVKDKNDKIKNKKNDINNIGKKDGVK